MSASGTTLEFLTFLLAPVGYAGLAAVAVMAAGGRVPVVLQRVTSAIILLHVLMVWHVRYDWQVSEATRKGYAGFVMFHAALLAIISSTLTSFRVARMLLTGAFLTVTIGALAATVKYDVVRGYRIPVTLIALAGIIGLVRRDTAAFSRSP